MTVHYFNKNKLNGGGKNYSAYLFLFILTLLQCFYFLSIDESFPERFRYVIQTFAFFVLLASLNKKLLNISLIFSFIITCFIYPTQTLYGSVGYSYVTAIFYTNTNEALSYLKIIPWGVYAMLILLGIFTFYIIKSKRINIQISNKVKWLLLLFLLSFPLKKIVFPRDTKEDISEYFYILPLKKIALVHLYFEVKKEDEFIKKASKTPPSWNILERKEQAPNKNIVVVIGESVRKDCLHSYGFSVENTPFIDTSNCIQFSNYVATASHTVPSLLRTIALSNDLLSYELSNNIVTLSKAVGYETHWISNQGKIGIYNSPISIIGCYSDFYHFDYKKDTKPTAITDDEMLPLFYKVLEKKNSIKKMIVLHMYGSHPTACDRTAGAYTKFIQSKEISCYDETIRNLDSFLNDVYVALQKTEEDFELVYFSDHGLKIQENKTFVHTEDVKEAYDIPLLIWNSKITAPKKINVNRTAKDFLHLFCEILEVKTENIQRNYTFISDDEYVDTIEVLIDSGDTNIRGKVKYKDLKSNPISTVFEE